METLTQLQAVVPNKHKKKDKTSILNANSNGPLAKKSKINSNVDKTAKSNKLVPETVAQDMMDRYPVLKNEGLVKKFLDVSMTNNQKGRIRQIAKEHLKGTPAFLLPDVIHNKIQAIIKNSESLTEPELRKIRVFYNMLKTAIENEKMEDSKPKDKKSVKTKIIKSKKEPNEDVKEVEKPIKEKKIKVQDSGDDNKKEKTVQKVKGPKRYVVFLGNLPLDVNKEMIMKHFAEMSDHIKDIRIPKRENKRSSIAYLELANEPTFELSLSKHHSMMGNRRINVQYTTQKDGKITKEVAKGKSSKLLALQKSGHLIGSLPMNKKRSFRRKKMKQALAKQNKDV